VSKTVEIERITQASRRESRRSARTVQEAKEKVAASPAGALAPDRLAQTNKRGDAVHLFDWIHS
jgi:hypothetical protein